MPIRFTRPSKPLQPIDRVALSLILILSLLIALLVWGGDRTRPYVKEFSWQNQQVGAENTFFMLTFSRPMDHASVEANFHIKPPLPGRVSWAGRRMVYTLTHPAPYGTSYRVELLQAQQNLGKSGNPLQPFVGEFRTRDCVLAYIGVEAEEKGRLMLYNLTREHKTPLTPKNWVVTDFQPYPTSEQILFAASEQLDYGPGLWEQQLYSVTTGLGTKSTQPPIKIGEIKLVLDNFDYQNLQFDLSPDGQAIVVKRVNRNNFSDTRLWIRRGDTPWQPFVEQPGGDFLFTPDSGAIASMQEQGVAILPLFSSAKPLDFFPQFSQVLSFSRDGVRAAMVKDRASYAGGDLRPPASVKMNSDLSQSLFLVTNRGLKKQLLRTKGEFQACQFDASAENLYCLMTQLVQKEEYSQQQSLQIIDLKTFEVRPLWVTPTLSQMQMSLSPDNLMVALDRVETKDTLPAKGELMTEIGSAIATSYLILLPVVKNTSKATHTVSAQELAVQGFHPRWLP